ncbi:ubiquitin-protein ligase E3 C [Puccinia graminis f. sp. tritici CRL 75-36-700-3]|uniref:HECT-type E3 ubiquitin transferase n=1 Tax=Puccinia graminis f. sp. tritici (strain CRL 75-36-700-3 / race SCCL) TaxID=418459 RepID=E3KC90_PUCGT|nr:ubiquitin-protein ligase E3 C [Puccinia graminis f. sp. tritici CRL 75-36-700-3]EFP81848.1 ubiquitin-protein ligase E3 C [Puccinia graminis f. sp. tritici CRL 75-36-700-3]
MSQRHSAEAVEKPLQLALDLEVCRFIWRERKRHWPDCYTALQRSGKKNLCAHCCTALSAAERLQRLHPHPHPLAGIHGYLPFKWAEIYPNPHSYSCQPLSLNWKKFLGRVLGKALYKGILININFADFFLNKCLGKQSYLDDLASLDPEFYQGLIFLKYHKGGIEADLLLNFTVTNNEFDVLETIELIPEGLKTSVTAQNRINYIYLMLNYKLKIQLESQLDHLWELGQVTSDDQNSLRATASVWVGKMEVQTLPFYTIRNKTPKLSLESFDNVIGLVGSGKTLFDES